MSEQNNIEDKTMKSLDVLVCIPAYNAESTISEAVKRCQKFADLVLVINDGSSDNTEKVARKAGADIITHRKNRGYGGAIKTALEEGLKRTINWITEPKNLITYKTDIYNV